MGPLPKARDGEVEAAPSCPGRPWSQQGHGKPVGGYKVSYQGVQIKNLSAYILSNERWGPGQTLQYS